MSLALPAWASGDSDSSSPFPIEPVPARFANSPRDLAGDKNDLSGIKKIVNIPQIEGNFTLAEGWHMPDYSQVLRGLEFIDFSQEEAKAIAEMNGLSVGRMSVLVTKHPEPFDGYNPAFRVSWLPIPASISHLPEFAKNEALADIVMGGILPMIQKHDPKFRLLEKPKPIAGEGSGVGVTFRHGLAFKSGQSKEGLIRLYLTPGKDHLIKISLAIPEEREEAESVVADLWAMFESLEIAR